MLTVTRAVSLAAFSFACMLPRLCSAFSEAERIELIQRIRAFDKKTQRLSATFEGTRVTVEPDGIPSLREGSPPTMAREVTEVAGTYKKDGRAYAADYRFSVSDTLWKVICDGKNVANFRSDGKKDLQGKSGSLNPARYKSAIPIIDHFGIFFPIADEVIQWASLEEMALKSPSIRLDRTAGIEIYRLIGLSDSEFFIKFRSGDPAGLQEFGSSLNIQTLRLTSSWKHSNFVSVDGISLPSTLTYAFKHEENGTVWTDETFTWKLSDLSLDADRKEFLAPVPEGMVLSTYDGKASRKVAVMNGSVLPVEADFGTPEYARKQLIKKAVVGGTVLSAAGIFFGWIRRRHRNIS